MLRGFVVCVGSYAPHKWVSQVPTDLGTVCDLWLAGPNPVSIEGENPVQHRP